VRFITELIVGLFICNESPISCVLQGVNEISFHNEKHVNVASFPGPREGGKKGLVSTVHTCA